ncbi:hypothetical protein LZC95_14250 [Pendulispora brunnea]|uniref:Uncharacterized protein n=1 Tax=Pendulispora brunnea TaxID=2905690 RepID=A0ABZ2KLZ4_9BACT
MKGPKVPTFKEMLKNFELSEEDRKKLSPEDLAVLEEAIARMKNDETEPVEVQNLDRYDAKGMRRVGDEYPPNWGKKK